MRHPAYAMNTFWPRGFCVSLRAIPLPTAAPVSHGMVSMSGSSGYVFGPPSPASPSTLASADAELVVPTEVVGAGGGRLAPITGPCSCAAPHETVPATTDSAQM